MEQAADGLALPSSLSALLHHLVAVLGVISPQPECSASSCAIVWFPWPEDVAHYSGVVNPWLHRPPQLPFGPTVAILPVPEKGPVAHTDALLVFMTGSHDLGLLLEAGRRLSCSSS